MTVSKVLLHRNSLQVLNRLIEHFAVQIITHCPDQGKSAPVVYDRNQGKERSDSIPVPAGCQDRGREDTAAFTAI